MPKMSQKKGGGKALKFPCYSVLCMVSIGSFHIHDLTSNSSGEVLELVYCDVVPIRTQIGYVVDVIPISFTLIKNVVHVLDW